MITKRIFTNFVVFVLMATGLIYIGMTKFVLIGGGGRHLVVTFADGSGLTPRSDVTMRGVPVGAVENVKLTREGTARVTITLDPEDTVPEGSTVAITRRSPIGDLTIDITPGSGPDLPDNAQIPISDTILPPDPELTIEVLDRVLSAVPPEQLHSLVHELATALRGRAQDLATLSVAGADLPEKILEVRSQLVSLIHNGPKVLDVLATHSHTLADDLTETARLADILRDRRFDLVSLSENGARFAEVTAQLLASEKPNIACLLGSLAHVNGSLSERQHLDDLKATLALNHFFFDGVEQSVKQSTTNPYAWFRVFFLPPQQPGGTAYAHKRSPPGVYGGNGCHSMYGGGVGPATQSPLPHLVKGSKLRPGS